MLAAAAVAVGWLAGGTQTAGFRFAGAWSTRSGRHGAAAVALSAWPTYVFTRVG